MLHTQPVGQHLLPFCSETVLAMIYAPVNSNSARHLLKFTNLTVMSKY